MLPVTSLIQHLSSLNPSEHPARQVLFNFLQNLAEPGERLDASLINRFFFRVLTFSFWQQNKYDLFGEVNQVLDHFISLAQVDFDRDMLLGVDDIQAIQLDSHKALVNLVERFVASQVTPHDQFRVFAERDQQAIAVVRLANQELKVTSFNNTVAILRGELVPVCTDFCLHYDAQLGLQEGAVQQVRINEFQTARFFRHPSPTLSIRGLLVKGYLLQRAGVLDLLPLTEHAQVFYAVKRIEQFFIQRKSDPFYSELTSILEKAADLACSSIADERAFAKAAFARGKIAFELVYSEDKLMKLLLSHLEKSLLINS